MATQLSSLVTAAQSKQPSKQPAEQPARASSGSGRTEIGDMDTFLKLFMTQLNNQRPTKPQDSTKLVEQLATFSTVEQMQSTNEKVGKILEDLAQGQIRDGLAFIGKQVSGPGNSIGLEDGSARIAYDLPREAETVKIAVTRPGGGETVATLEGETEKGTHTLTWDGKTDQGKQLEDGRYTVSVSAKTADGSEVAAATRTSGVVRTVALDGDQAVLELANGARIAPDKVETVRAPDASAGSA